MRLEDICTVFTDGDWIESKDQSESGIRLVQTGNIGEGTYFCLLYTSDAADEL